MLSHQLPADMQEVLDLYLTRRTLPGSEAALCNWLRQVSPPKDVARADACICGHLDIPLSNACVLWFSTIPQCQLAAPGLWCPASSVSRAVDCGLRCCRAESWILTGRRRVPEGAPPCCQARSAAPSGQPGPPSPAGSRPAQSPSLGRQVPLMTAAGLCALHSPVPCAVVPCETVHGPCPAHCQVPHSAQPSAVQATHQRCFQS